MREKAKHISQNSPSFSEVVGQKNNRFWDKNCEKAQFLRFLNHAAQSDFNQAQLKVE